VVNAPWIVGRYSEAKRLATQRLNAYTLTNHRCTVPVFDEGIEYTPGDIVEVTHPIGLTAKQYRLMNNVEYAPGRWLLDLYEFDSGVYSGYVVTETSSADFGLIEGQAIPRVFTSEPTTPYRVGDLWVGGPSGDIMRCKTARASGAYNAGDWELASEYDKTAKNLQYNGDFELDVTTETDPTYWGRGTSGTPTYAMVWATEEAYWPPWAPNGHCFYANCDDAAEYVSINSNYFIPITQDSYYTLSAWVKQNNGRCFFGIRWYDKDKVSLSWDYVCMNNYESSEDWHQVISDPFRPSDYEATARYVKIRAFPQYQKVGYTMISRIQLVEAKNQVAWESSYSVAPGADKTSENTANNANNYTGNTVATSYTAAKCTDADADETATNTANNANNYTGNTVATNYTAAKCTDADADETATHTARNTTYIDGSVNQSGQGSVEFNNDILAYGSSSYNIRPESNGGAYCGTGIFRWYTVCTQGFSASDGSAIEIGSSGSKFKIHITNYSDDGGGWYSYDAYID